MKPTKTWSTLDAKFTKELALNMADADASIDIDLPAHEHVEDTDDAKGGFTSGVELITSSADGANRDIDHESTPVQPEPLLVPSEDSSLVSFSALGEILHERAVKRNGLAVIVPPPRNRWEYTVFKDYDAVDEILEEYDDAGFVEYLVLFSDGSEDVVSLLF